MSDCKCACHPGPYEHSSTNSVTGCCWWEHLTKEQKHNSDVLLWKCYRFLKSLSCHDFDGNERTHKHYAALYAMVADRVHDDDFPDVGIW